jgi:hypothetical protein
MASMNDDEHGGWKQQLLFLPVAYGMLLYVLATKNLPWLVSARFSATTLLGKTITVSVTLQINSEL